MDREQRSYLFAKRNHMGGLRIKSMLMIMALVFVTACAKELPPPPPAPPAPPPEPKTIILDNVLFEFGKTTVSPKAKDILNRLIEFMVENPDRQVELSGHTDSTGPERYNQILSERRATAVRNHLIQIGVKRGINLSRNITAKGLGESAPIVSNSTREGRAQNRRVEMVVQ